MSLCRVWDPFPTHVIHATDERPRFNGYDLFTHTMKIGEHNLLQSLKAEKKALEQILEAKERQIRLVEQSFGKSNFTPEDVAAYLLKQVLLPDRIKHRMVPLAEIMSHFRVSRYVAENTARNALRFDYVKVRQDPVDHTIQFYAVEPNPKS